MSTVRDKFHELGNWHNKISLASIMAREFLRETKQNSAPELSETVEKVFKILSKIEGYVQSADHLVGSMKPFIYEKVGADEDISIKENGQGGGV